MSGTLIGKVLISSALFLMLGAFASAVPIAFETGTYHLGNHPDGNAAPPTYGARIDNLWDGDTFTFDFECVGCNMELRYNGSTIRIDGIAYGGHDDGAARIDDDFDGFYEFHVAYNTATVVENNGAGDADGLQDIGRLGNTGGMIGTLEFLDAGIGMTSEWDLKDKQGSHPASLRVGNEDDDAGHRDYVGISGWGWLMFRESGTTDFVDADGAQDWLFIARRRSNTIPAPGAASLLLIGLVAIAARRKNN